MHTTQVVVIAGPTGTGKSDVAAVICAMNDGIIVSADSVQAYKGVNIGANKPDALELQRTPHILVDMADHTVNYNAAVWRRDALQAINGLLGEKFDTNDEEYTSPEIMKEACTRKSQIDKWVNEVKAAKHSEQICPVVVGGTMLYLEWLVHGRPDSIRSSPTAVARADLEMSNFNDNSDWIGATDYVSSKGSPFAERVRTLFENDWYRLRRILEVALTWEENPETDPTKIYTGVRAGALKDTGLDVRCFFLCPDDRMKHTKVVDRRCEDMIKKGLITETTDLLINKTMPEMASKAIGYRQTIEYLEREGAQLNDEASFQLYLERFAAVTRQYAKKQMQWFRKDKEFIFVPVPVDTPKDDRVQSVADQIKRLMSMSRDEYDNERLGEITLSAEARARNEAQAKGMKFYMFESQVFTHGSADLESIVVEADNCASRLHDANPSLKEEE